MDNQGKIAQLHKAYGHPVRTVPTVMDIEEAQLRCRLMFEEFCEFVAASGLYIQYEVGGLKGLINHQNTTFAPNGLEPNLVLQIDGIADMQVINYGTACCMGINADQAMDIAHESNMTKFAEDGTPIVNGVTEGYRADEESFQPFTPIGKIIKGPNYQEPDFSIMLEPAKKKS